MTEHDAMTDGIFPVPCPQCGESQNVTPGGFDPAAEPFGPVTCMVCGRAFSRDEYITGLEICRRQSTGTAGTA